MPGGRYADISGRQESSNSSLIFSVGYYKTLVQTNSLSLLHQLDVQESRMEPG